MFSVLTVSAVFLMPLVAIGSPDPAQFVVLYAVWQLTGTQPIASSPGTLLSIGRHAHAVIFISGTVGFCIHDRTRSSNICDY